MKENKDAGKTDFLGIKLKHYFGFLMFAVFLGLGLAVATPGKDLATARQPAAQAKSNSKSAVYSDSDYKTDCRIAGGFMDIIDGARNCRCTSNGAYVDLGLHENCENYRERRAQSEAACKSFASIQNDREFRHFLDLFSHPPKGSIENSSPQRRDLMMAAGPVAMVGAGSVSAAETALIRQGAETTARLVLDEAGIAALKPGDLTGLMRILRSSPEVAEQFFSQAFINRGITLSTEDLVITTTETTLALTGPVGIALIVLIEMLTNASETAGDTIAGHYASRLPDMLEKETSNSACSLIKQEPKLARAVLGFSKIRAFRRISFARNGGSTPATRPAIAVQ